VRTHYHLDRVTKIQRVRVIVDDIGDLDVRVTTTSLDPRVDYGDGQLTWSDTFEFTADSSPMDEKAVEFRHSESACVPKVKHTIRAEVAPQSDYVDHGAATGLLRMGCPGKPPKQLTAGRPAPKALLP
jgi:hypothetical protein